ncbi:MAG: peptidylprolyl isomerase [Ignavibacteria bacterium]|nr:peptidylprolyl isomerase [Ignavibacteria bacterium]
MGTFERIRKISPIAIGIFVVIFVGFMVATDADIGGILQQGMDYKTAELAKINGDKLLYREYEEKIREQLELQRKQNPEGNPIDELQIRKSTWTEMFEEILLKQQAKEIGIKVTDEEILDVLLDDPPSYLRQPFTDSAGNFQRQTYLEIITNPDVILNRLPAEVPQEEKQRIVQQFKKDLLNIENYLRKEKLQNGVKTLVSIASSFVSPSYAKEKYIVDNATADVRVIFFDIKNVPDEKVKVSDEEIKKYYDENKRFFPEKHKRKIKYVIFKIQPSFQDTQNVLKSINRFAKELEELTDIEGRSKLFERKFSEHNGEISEYKLAKDLPLQLAPYITTIPIGQVVGPIQTNEGTYFIRLEDVRKGENTVVRASHILIEFGNNKDSALTSAKSILKKAKAGEDFANLAKIYSQDRGSAMNGGDLGYFGKGMMVKPFEDACFAAKPGEIVGPVESQFGYHIIKVWDKKSEEYKYSFIKFLPQVSRQTEKAIHRDAKLFREKVLDEVPFDTVAKQYNLTVRTTDFFDISRPTLGSNYLTAMVFESKVGDVLEPIELTDQGIVVAQVVDERKAGYQPLEDLRERITFTLQKRKKLDILSSKAEETYNKLKNLGTLANFREIDSTLPYYEWLDLKNNGFIAGIGQDWVFTTKIFMLPLNTISTPFRGERGYYIVEVFRKSVPSDNLIKEELKKNIQQITSNWRQSAYFIWFNKIKENAEVKDYRFKFYREY